MAVATHISTSSLKQFFKNYEWWSMYDRDNIPYSIEEYKNLPDRLEFSDRLPDFSVSPGNNEGYIIRIKVYHPDTYDPLGFIGGKCFSLEAILGVIKNLINIEGD